MNIAKKIAEVFGGAGAESEPGPVAAALAALDGHVAKLRRLRAVQEPLSIPNQRLSEMLHALSVRRADLARGGMHADAVTEATKAERAEIDAFAEKHRKTIERATALGRELGTEASLLAGLHWDVLHAEIVGPEAAAYEEGFRAFQAAQLRFLAYCQAADSLHVAGRIPLMPGLSMHVSAAAPINEPALKHLSRHIDLTSDVTEQASQLVNDLKARSTYHDNQEQTHVSQ